MLVLRYINKWCFTERAQGAFLIWVTSAFLEGNESNLSWLWVTSKEQEPFLWCFTCAAQCWGVGLPGEGGPQPQGAGQLLGSLLPWGHWETSPEKTWHLQPAEHWAGPQPFPSHPSAHPTLHPLEHCFVKLQLSLGKHNKPFTHVPGVGFSTWFWETRGREGIRGKCWLPLKSGFAIL